MLPFPLSRVKCVRYSNNLKGENKKRHAFLLWKEMSERREGWARGSHPSLSRSRSTVSAYCEGSYFFLNFTILGHDFKGKRERNKRKHAEDV